MLNSENNTDNAMDTSEPPSASKESVCTGHLINQIAKHVFAEYLQEEGTSSFQSSGKVQSTTTFQSQWRNICQQLERESVYFKSIPSTNQSFRIGPACVNFNRKKLVGSFDFEDNDLKICSKDNFSTIYANTCIFKGKWQYELVLESKGVMQIGWATLNCQFSQENGVGDTADSYAYDGNRQRKWNVAPHKYGEKWNCNDIISCTIDLDKGEISYFRNGRPLGIAFDTVKTGPGIAYFPALSLALDESLHVNFGETPFAYPQEGFDPLQAPPLENLVLARLCLKWIMHLVKISVHWKEYKDLTSFEEERKESRRIALLIIVQHIGSLLAPILSHRYIIEDALLPVLKQLSESLSDHQDTAGSSTLAQQEAHTFLKFLTSFLQEQEQKKVFNNLFMCLQRRYRHIPQDINYAKQKCSLRIVHLILSDSTIRKFCLRHVLLEKESHYRFNSFACIKCMDKVQFKQFADINFWCSKNGSFRKGDEKGFYETVATLERAYKELEELQISVLKLLLTSDDAVSYHNTSRALFLAKFRQLVKQLVGGRTAASFIAPSVILSLFNCYLLLFLRLWKEEIEEELGDDTIPPSLFYDGHLDFEAARLGGLESHLKKKYAVEREQALKEARERKQILNPMEPSKNCSSSIENMDDSLPSTSGTVLGDILMTEVESVKEKLQRVNVREVDQDKKQKKNKEELRTSLHYLLNGVICLYHQGRPSQVENVVSQTDDFFSNVTYLEELLKKKQKYLAEQENHSHFVLNELNRSIAVLQSKLKEQSYQHAWNSATVLSTEYLQRILVFLRIVLGALKSSSKQGGLFTFVPDFYVEVLTQLFHDLRHLVLCDQNEHRAKVSELKLYRPGGIPLSKDLFDEYQEMLLNGGEFLALHFYDPRIIFADSKDSLIQALAGFVCHRPGLEALERMPLESRLDMVKTLLQPYENRAWAQNNWILVRFWKGKGFAFRYTKSPHLTHKLGPKPAHCEIQNANLSSAPYYSETFLAHVSEVLMKPEISTPFLNSLLNQLNWVFSEFIGMLQEIQNASNRPERVFIDSRQLRICATCFDLALALLRVLEMIVNVSRNIFLDPNRQDSKPLLKRLCQLLCQVLNRVSICSGCFSHVVNLEIPGLETIHYYPILTAVIGIVSELLRDDIYYKKVDLIEQSATKTFLDEASLQISSLDSLLGGKGALKPRFCPPQDPCSSSSSVEMENVDSLLPEPTITNTTSTAHLFTSPECNCKPPRFCLRKYPDDILEYEIHKVVDVINHLRKASIIKEQHTSTEDVDNLCTICYATPSDAIFMPCAHTSCSTCITHHLMNRARCFFCKNVITEVKDNTGKILYTSPAQVKEKTS